MPADLMRDRLVYRVFHSDAEDAVDLLMEQWVEKFGKTGLSGEPVVTAEDARAQAQDVVATVRDDHAYFVIAPSGRIEIVAASDIADAWEDEGNDVFVEELAERHRQIEKGYTPEHDDAEGFNHLRDVAIYELSHFGETPTNESIRHDIIRARATLLAAIELLDRAIKAQQTE